MTTAKRIRPLFLVFPHNRLKIPPKVPELRDGYELRTYQEGDEVSLAKLLASVAATTRLIQAGYSNIRVVTNDHRLSALKVYLKIGFVPFLYTEDSEGRWKVVCDNLNWSFTPNDWVKPEKQRFD